MRKRLLIVACGDYSQALGNLSSSIPDAKRLGSLLAKRTVGNFSVNTVLNPSLVEAQVAVNKLLSNALSTDDLIVLYMSGHGVKDSYGRFYLALPETDIARLSATALSGRYIREQMTDTVARRLLLILDTCYAGAFNRDMIAKAAPATSGLTDEFADERGHVVFAAASAAQYAFETKDINPTSIFTKTICDGIESGEADLNADGWITLEELFSYTSEKMGEDSTAQKPEASYLGVTGHIPIARAPKQPASMDLAEDVTLALTSVHAELRLAAARILGVYATGGDKHKASIARARLRGLINDESDEVRHTASSLLGRRHRHRSSSVSFKTQATPPQSDAWVSLNGRSLKLAGDQAPKFASFGMHMPALATVAVRLSSSYLYIYATDGNRLDWRRLTPLACGEQSFFALLSADDFSVLSELPDEAEVRIDVFDRAITFSISHSVLRIRRDDLQYQYPEVDSIVKENRPICSMRRLDLIENIEILIGDRGELLEQPVVLTGTPGPKPTLQISVYNKPKRRTSRVVLAVKGAITATSLHLDYQPLVEALDAFQEETVYLHLPRADGPMLILNKGENASHRHAILPVK